MAANHVLAVGDGNVGKMINYRARVLWPEQAEGVVPFGDAVGGLENEAKKFQ